MTGTDDTSEPQPYAPEGIDRIGTPPVNGEGGERGTSVFPGNSEFNADGTAKVDVPSEGPAKGTWYHEAADPAPIETGVETQRESATADKGDGAPDQL